MFDFGSLFKGMAGQGGAGAEVDPQKAAASQITAGSKPSLSKMQEAMGGLLTSEGMKKEAGSLMDSVKGDFGSLFNDLSSAATSIFGSNPAAANFSEVTGQPVQDPASLIPEQGIVQPPPTPAEPPPVEPPPPKVPTADNGWGAVKNDSDAISWALKRGDITPQDAAWLNKWQSEANDGNNWIDGSGGTSNWDYMNSGLTNQNKGIVDKFYKSVSGNWGDAPGQAAPQQPSALPKGLLDMTPEQIEAAKNYARGSRR